MRTARVPALAMIPLALLVLAAAMPPAAPAQTEKPGAPPGQPDMGQYMQMMQPGPEHQHLAKLVGKWKSANKLWMDPAGPPMETEGAMEWQTILGGRLLEGHYTSTVMGQPFEGLSIDGYDRYKKEYYNIWFDTMGTGMMHMTGSASADGRTTGMKGLWFEPMLNAELPGRSVSTWVDDNTLRMEMYETKGGQEMKVMEVVYTRVK